ncbi:MAG: spoIVB [Anaerosolibacter sp.]|uniref:SpoIVB peptidase n=1 Tax=Anaerosolibacter sp. TaxID=1872527 RepID=UPI002634E616|nr:SpoIVB peptidase [Anaerosolibacter sp.]MDF2546454.1 spoIVB [Anaerosolibacter sp.]
MDKDRTKRLISLFVVAVFMTAFYVFVLNEIIQFPTELRLFEGESQSLNVKFPLKAENKQDTNNSIRLINHEKNKDNQSISLNPVKLGKTDIQLKLLGVLPIKTLSVEVIPKVKVIPGGQSIGVKLNTKGVLIVGLEEIEGIDGKKYNPGYTAGLNIGDSILEIGSEKVRDAEHVTNLINNNGNKMLQLRIKRGEKLLDINIHPVKSADDGEFRLGLWVRDKTAGVGTLTFYHPDSQKFGALGHAITDIDTGLLLAVNSGEVVKSKVASVQQGKKGKPGEIKGIFYETTKPIGNLEKNTHYGIYGKAYEDIENPLYHQPIEIGFQHQVKEGKATILTTVDSNEVQAYEISIEKVNHQKNPNVKSMIIRVTDKRLLEKSGGIVQGMSGSPIIQDGKLIGAVTHVFVHDPTKGYGLFIEWMLNECGVDLTSYGQLANGNE